MKRSELAVGMVVEARSYPRRGARMIVLSLDPWVARRAAFSRRGDTYFAVSPGEKGSGLAVAVEQTDHWRPAPLWVPAVIAPSQIVKIGTYAAHEAHQRAMRDAAMAAAAAAREEVEAVAALLPPGSGAFEYDGPRKDRVPRIVVRADVLAGVLAKLDDEALVELSTP